MQTFRASRWGGMLSWTKLLMPDSITITDTRVEICKRKLLGLSHTTEEVPFSRIASVRLKSGLFFSDIIIETTGGATADLTVKMMKKRVGRAAADVIRELVA
ncbi:MAG: hypothetical protein FH749_07005 [Firmicutes bacterium]|nr:hypothetical protein [Bacillota bacterium]